MFKMAARGVGRGKYQFYDKSWILINPKGKYGREIPHNDLWRLLFLSGFALLKVKDKALDT